MPNIIKLLPDSVANQIAAGEVVQRPASIVKELLENAIDANGKEIKLVVKDAGKALIQVIDNGIGMSDIDARMSFERHATSKLSSSADLFNIKTMGFRGEALASIAAVAQVEMETCCKHEELGTKIIVEGSIVKSQTPVVTSLGTKISVKNIFFNVPARRNFLKSNSVENNYILDEFQRVALANSSTSFFMYQDSKMVYRLPSASLSTRIVHTFGESYKKQLLPCNEQTDLLQISGYIGKPEYAKKTRGDQFFFVNHRYIKSHYLNHAVKSAFERLLPQDVFPFYVLFIDVAPNSIDINVHPTKTEIKFEDERMVYSIVVAAIKKALAINHVVPSIDFDQNTNFDPFKSAKLPRLQSFITASERKYIQLKGIDSKLTINKESDLDGVRSSSIKDIKDCNSENNILVSYADSEVSKNQRCLSRTFSGSFTAKDGIRLQLHGRYILTQIKSGLLIIDQVAAHERILYENFLNTIKNSSIIKQQFLFPKTITLNYRDVELIIENKIEFERLGFSFGNHEREAIIVDGCSIEICEQNTQQVIEELIENFKIHKSFSTSYLKKTANVLAKYSKIKTGKSLQKEEIDLLIDQLFACQNPNYTPNGKKPQLVCL